MGYYYWQGKFPICTALSDENWICSCYEIWQTFTHQGLAFSPLGNQTHLSSTSLSAPILPPPCFTSKVYWWSKFCLLCRLWGFSFWGETPKEKGLLQDWSHFVKVNMKRGLRGPGASARCIFSGSRGEVIKRPLNSTNDFFFPRFAL